MAGNLDPDPKPNPSDPITDYSRTQRVVLLVDLNPLLHLSDATPFLTSLITSIKILLSFPPLSSSLFAFKLLFSSLSPLLSSSKLQPFVPISSLSLSFSDSSTALLSLSETLGSFYANGVFSSLQPSLPRASCLAASMRQLVHDYPWDRVIEDSTMGTLLNCNMNGSTVVGSNLVVLFSPVCRSIRSLSEFLNVEIEDECLKDIGLFCEKLHCCFENVNDAFVSRDIRFSWVDVRWELEGDARGVEINGSELKSGFFLSGIRNLGWGFCSTDSIVLGSVLVPFGLIYPKIVISSKFFDFNHSYKKLDIQLSLEILDVREKPLECKVCDLEMVNLKVPLGNGCPGSSEEKNFLGLFGDGKVKLHIKAVQRHSECGKFVGHLGYPILVCESTEDAKKDQKESSSGFFVDRVLDMMAMESCEFVRRKSIPIWQILLSFLYRQGYWSLVSVSNGCSDLHMGILKPFTVSSALLCIIEDGISPQNMLSDFGGANVAQFGTKMDKTCKANMDMNCYNGSRNSKDGPSPSIISGTPQVAKGKRIKKKSSTFEDLTWNAFCKSAFERSEQDLEEVYFARECNNSKKLKFLKCWRKQIKKSCCSLILQETSKPCEDIQREMEDRLTKSDQESEQPVSSSASAGENILSEVSRIQDEVALDFRSETSEGFFSDLPNKIQQGLESEGVDLGALAERLVKSSVYWLYQKCGTESPAGSQTLEVKSDDACGRIVPELTKLLLREPKDLVAKHKNNEPSFQASGPGCTGVASKDKVKEYEMQILLRMEILRSEAGASIGESIKQKFVKQICLFLDAIQCHLEGGFFGDWSLDKYVGKIIKRRYCLTLGDVVHRIYTKMDLLLFADEDKSPNPSFNSEDSNQSCREKSERDEIGEDYGTAEAGPVQLQQKENGSSLGIKQEEHARRLMEAQKSRERARRFASFTSWMPDLQRVWAPKQPKMMKPKSDRPQRKLSKRKERRSACYDRVCETPMTGIKRTCSRASSINEENYQDSGSQSGGSVSKALFQDD